MNKTELTILHAGLEGQGVGHDEEGNIYFVPFGVPGDKVRVGFTPTQKRYRDAVILDILEPSPSRVQSHCPQFGECGGCDWLHWSYPAQLEAKQQTVEHVFARSQLSPKVLHPIKGADPTVGYRNKIQLRYENTKLGFFKKRSREIVDVKNCLVAHPKINEALKELRGTLDANSPRTKVELFIDEQGALHKSENNPHSAQGFRQIHEEQNLNLRHTVRKMVENSQSEKVLELFSGDGNLTASYLDLVEQVLSVEGASHSIEKAKQAVESDKVQYLQDFITIKLRKKIPREFRNSYDTLLLDPPRSGLGFDLSSLVHSDLKSIIYVSCSLVEFAKDVQCLKDSYQLEEVQPLDMFPQTRHVEIVARFSKVSS